MLQRFNMRTHTIPMLSKKPRRATADLHQDILGTRNSGLGYLAKRTQPVLYDGNTLLDPTHTPVSVWDSDDVLVYQVTELSREQAYWLNSQDHTPSKPVTPFVRKGPPPSQVLASLHLVKVVFPQFESIIIEQKIATQKAKITTLKAEAVGKKNSGPTGTPTKPKVLALRMYNKSVKYNPPQKRADWVQPTLLPKKKQNFPRVLVLALVQQSLWSLGSLTIDSAIARLVPMGYLVSFTDEILMQKTNQTIHMIMPSKDTLHNGRKGIGFKNPSYFEKAKDLRHSLYDEKVIGQGYTLMFLIHSDEALEIEKFKRARENKIEFSYDYEKIIIDLEDKVVSLLEKEKANLKTIESLKSIGFESSDNAIPESEIQSENDCQVVEKECVKLENSKVIAPGFFKLSVSQSVSPMSMSKTSCDSMNAKNLDTFSSVRRLKHSGVKWKKKGLSNTSNIDLSSVSLLKLNKNVKRYSRKDLLSCNNSHL
nr:hypothetical protein [Tanacetum cinerariifolium]